MSRHDVAIIGGGPAGAALAAELAAAGRDVALIEREAAPRDKVCGEFLSPEAVAVLDRLGIDLAALGAVPIRGVGISRGSWRSERPLPYRAMSLSRRAPTSNAAAGGDQRGPRPARRFRARPRPRRRALARQPAGRGGHGARGRARDRQARPPRPSAAERPARRSRRLQDAFQARGRRPRGAFRPGRDRTFPARLWRTRTDRRRQGQPLLRDLASSSSGLGRRLGRGVRSRPRMLGAFRGAARGRDAAVRAPARHFAHSLWARPAHDRGPMAHRRPGRGDPVLRRRGRHLRAARRGARGPRDAGRETGGGVPGGARP
ncbi:FAD-dependent oxidoreductase [Chenggangzhangella methanolivorans]|uniref:FAD-dependent oxidoreductase n=1 Tax=Chenggangzhangella methanolivorans TaxID=1437009 RepID=A0A9E6UK62_9HYPH|nr:FAD-dependent oxidoreductase [Chenggangzhangella methanolivorans]